MTARPPQTSTLHQQQVDQAIAASLKQVKKDKRDLLVDLMEAKDLHDADLFKTQDSYQDDSNNDATVLVLVKFPDSRSTTSCRFTKFNTGRIRLTYQQVLATGSALLANLLVNERHQRCARRAAAPLPHGVDHVLDLSPTTDENDYTIALQLLSVTHAIQTWHRSVAWGASPLTVAGHDDVCTCLLPFNEPYPIPTPPESIKSKHGNVCILDTKEWPLEEHRKIDDFCTTRWAANTLRLFRAISMPPGQKDLVIDSAPRMWTMVGLFAKLEMTNYDILVRLPSLPWNVYPHIGLPEEQRDEVVAWFNADQNYTFVELCPEETLHVGLILKTPLLTEPAFRILVNERALEVAGGQPRLEPAATLFGRRCSNFTGTAVAESISRMIEHASNTMAERYKLALDGLCSDDALDLLNIPQWKELRALDDAISSRSGDANSPQIRARYDYMMAMVRQMFQDAVNRVVRWEGGDLPTELIDSDHNDHFLRSGLTIEQIDEKRAFSVPQLELLSTQSFANVYTCLNYHQRALTSMTWHGLIAMADDLSSLSSREVVADAVIDFSIEFEKARRGGKLLGPNVPGAYSLPIDDGSCDLLFQEIMTKLKDYVRPLVTRDEQAFIYTIIPHLVLALNDHEMNFLRLADDERTFQTEAPETDVGPSGPGPAFHTGQTIPSVSDLDFEKLAIESDDGASTVVGSMAVQDGISTVYKRSRVLARSAAPSMASSQFTDGDVSAEYSNAEFEVPADHQRHGQSLAQIVEQANEEYDVADLGLGADVDLGVGSDFGTFTDDEDADEVEPARADHGVDDLIVNAEAAHSGAPPNELEDEAAWSEDLGGSDFEVITKDETV